MSIHKHSHFIPSPFKCVTQYENQFIKDWNGNTAKAMKEVLEFISDETKTEIKKIG